MAAVKTEVRVSQLVDMIESKFQINTHTMFLRMANSMALRIMLSNVSGRRKSKMAAAKPEMHVSLLVDICGSKLDILC